MTVREALSAGVFFLTRAAVDTPYLDACLLLAEALGLTKAALIVAYPDTIDADADRYFQEALRRRASGIPVSYIRHKKEFYGLEFYVDERVLVPRPDTETLIEAARELIAGRSVRRVLDLCVGSGCIAISLKKNHPDLEVIGADVSEEALAVFALNSVKLLGAPLPFVRSDLFQNVTGIFDLIVSNPPYIEDEQVCAMKAAGWPEPALALAGGADGLSLEERIVDQAPAFLAPGGTLVLEADPGQMEKLAHKMRQRGYINIGTRPDLAGRARALQGSTASG